MESNKELLIKAKDGDKQSRKKLVENNVGLVWSIVRRYGDRGYDKEDLFQIGCIGLIKSIDRFDITLDVAFSTYAISLIQGEIRRFLRDDGIIKVSRIAKNNNMKIKRARDEYVKNNNKEPSLGQLMDITGLNLEEISIAMESDINVDSIYRCIGQKDGNSICLGDVIKDNTDEYDEKINHICLNELLGKLNEEERKIINMRYFNNMTQTQIAKEFGITQVKVSRLESKIIKKLRNNIT